MKCIFGETDLGSQTVPLSLQKNKNMKGIIYVRVSSEEQVKGTSLEHQDDLCRSYCQAKGIEVMGMYREEGASAKTADRKEFLRAIEYCRKNKGKVLSLI